MHIGRTIPEMIMFALKHCGYKDRLHNRTKLWEVDLAPSENISSLSYTKITGLSSYFPTWENKRGNFSIVPF